MLQKNIIPEKKYKLENGALLAYLPCEKFNPNASCTNT